MNFEKLKDNKIYNMIRVIISISFIFVFLRGYLGFSVSDYIVKFISIMFFVIYFVNFVLVYKNKSLFWNLLIICASIFSIISIIF